MRLRGDSLTNISMSNCNFVHSDSITNASGVVINMSSKYKFELDLELHMKVNGCEELWLNLRTDVIFFKQITIKAIYLYPHINRNYIKNCTGTFVNTTSKINKRKDRFYNFGDLNIDTTINKRTRSSLLFLDHLISCCSLPIITIPTRVTKTSSTIIDHIITNDPSYIINPGVIRCKNKFSNHFVVFYSTNNYPTKLLNKTFYTIRDKSNFNTDAYRNKMHESVYNFITNLNELNDSNFDNTFENFVSLIQAVIKNHALLKWQLRKQQQLKNKPLVTKNISTVHPFVVKIRRTDLITF